MSSISAYYIENMKEIMSAKYPAKQERITFDSPPKVKVVRLSKLREMKSSPVSSVKSVRFSDSDEIFEIPARFKVVRLVKKVVQPVVIPIKVKVVRLVKKNKVVQAEEIANPHIGDLPIFNEPQIEVNHKKTLTDKYTSSSASFHIKKLPDFAGDQDINEWVHDPANSAGYKRIRYSFLKKVGLDKHITDKTGLEGSTKPSYKQGEQKKEANRGETVINALIQKKQVDNFTLFGCVLPPRRCRDVCTLEIVETEPKNIENRNLFCKQTKQFIFGNYKTFNKYGVQRFTLNNADFPFVPQDSLDSAASFLMSKKPGWLFANDSHRNENNFPTVQRRAVKFVSNDARRFWSCRVFSSGNNADYLKLCTWLAHSPSTNIVTYSEGARAASTRA